MPTRDEQRDRADAAQGVEPAAPPNQSGERQANREPQEPLEGTEELMLSGRRVLFVVDNQCWTDDLREQAERAGAEVGRASSEEELAERLSEPWDVFWLFRQFKGQNSMELIPELLARVPRPGVVLFALQGVTTGESVALQRARVFLLNGRSTGMNKIAEALQGAIAVAREIEVGRGEGQRSEPLLKVGESLSRAEYQVWRQLVEAQGGLVTHDALARGVLGRSPENQGVRNSISQHVHCLRDKLNSDAARIVTVRGEGYRLEIGHRGG